ncbi:MAG: hypothetical protein AAB943_01510 [Patescibacteria group bacterium]
MSLDRPNYNLGEQGPKTQEQIVDELEMIMNRQLSGPYGENVYEAVADLITKLETQYPGYKRHEIRLAHILSGSTLKEGHAPEHFDFPEREIERFVRGLESPLP